MEEETQAISEVPVTKAVEKDTNAGDIQVTHGDSPLVAKVEKKQEEENALDEEFIKIEKEAIDVKDGSHGTGTTGAKDEKPSITERNSSRELLEAQENMRELELELLRLAGTVKSYENENSHLKDELSALKEKLEESGRKYEELELSYKKLQVQTIEENDNHSLQLNTLQEALHAQEAKQRELIQEKESFDALSLELESSRKRMLEFEQQLQYSSGEAQKFEELHKQSGSHAESETKKALEFERLLEVAKLTAKEVEDQMSSLQEELKGLYEKIAENQKVEEALKTTAAELSAVQEDLALSKSHVVDLGERLSSKDAIIDELTRELNLRNTSETHLKEDISVLQNVFVSTKEELQVKVSELEEIKFKLQEEEKARESVEASFRTWEAEVLLMQEELAKINTEKKSLEAVVEDLTSNSKQLKELSIDLEEKLKISHENFSKSDSLLSQALSNNAELENKLKSLEDLYNESGTAASTATLRNLELEDLIQASNMTAEEANSQLRELETRFIAAEHKNVELEEQLNLVELKSTNAERELKEFSDKISELNTKLREVDEEKKSLNGYIQEYIEKIIQLESSLNQSSVRSSQLEEELKIVTGKCTEHEDRASMNHYRSLELEDLIQTSHSKLEHADRKVREFELLLEAEKYRIQELEQQISTLEKKCADAEASSRADSDKVTDLRSELEAFQARASSLEIALETANEKGRQLTESLHLAEDEKNRLEDALNSSSEKLAEVEKMLEILRNELNLTQEKLLSIEHDHKIVGLRESEVMVKLKLAEEKLEQQESVIEQTATRNSELELLHESLSRDSELKLQEAIANCGSKDSENQSLLEKLKNLEEQMGAAAEKSALFKEELDQSLRKMASLEVTNENLSNQMLEAENKSLKSYSENELLVETNFQLQNKVVELQELLDSALSVKEATAEQLVSHKNTIAELIDQYSKGSEILSLKEAHILEVETQLQETIQRLTERDAESKRLTEKFVTLEGQINSYQEQAHEAVGVAQNQKLELEESLVKLKHLEILVEELQTKSGQYEKESGGLAEANLKLAQEIALYESKMNDLQSKLSAALVEKDETVQQVLTLEKAIEDLTLKHTSELQRLQSQISSAIEEKNLLNETYQNVKIELQSAISHLEEELKEHKQNEDALRSEVENLKADTAEKSVLQTRVKELEEKLMKSESQMRNEFESVQAAAAEREAELRSKLEEHAHRVQDKELLNEQVLQLQEQLKLLQTRSVEQSDGVSPVDLKDGLEVKSRDFGPNISTPSKRKSKKKSEATSSQTSALSEIHSPTGQVSLLTTFKFISGVALVSVIVGIILGKRY
ncbi:Myosin-11 isoform X1 [Quillaja saponaria]|uniref:Myosin-11 isoform X1 n=1 Tax=Quillaja saponaria TaxID=32244 RepID=A0AAD7LKM7_QUISA|nr:Myosin-11 isoform X1 [Quillaja saponaria]